MELEWKDGVSFWNCIIPLKSFISIEMNYSKKMMSSKKHDRILSINVKISKIFNWKMADAMYCLPTVSRSSQRLYSPLVSGSHTDNYINERTLHTYGMVTRVSFSSRVKTHAKNQSAQLFINLDFDTANSNTAILTAGVGLQLNNGLQSHQHIIVITKNCS